MFPFEEESYGLEPILYEYFCVRGRCDCGPFNHRGDMFKLALRAASDPKGARRNRNSPSLERLVTAQRSSVSFNMTVLAKGLEKTWTVEPLLTFRRGRTHTLLKIIPHLIVIKQVGLRKLI